MEAVKQRAVAYDDFVTMEASSEERLEFHDGVVVAMSIPSLAHQRIVAQLASSLRAKLTGGPCGLLLGPRLRIEATNRTLAPDLVVVCDELARSARDRDALINPRLIIEVLSPTTEDYDLGTKFAQYRRVEGLAEYITVAQDRRFAGISRRVGDLWRFDETEGPTLEIDSLNVSLDLDDIYWDGFGAIIEPA